MAQTIMIAGGPKRGVPVYIMKKFDFVQMLEAVSRFKITTLHMVPPIVVVCPPLSGPLVMYLCFCPRFLLCELFIPNKETVTITL